MHADAGTSEFFGGHRQPSARYVFQRFLQARLIRVSKSAMASGRLNR